MKIIKKVFSTLADCIVPTLPILIGAGMLKVLIIIIGPNVLNLISESDNTYIVLSFVANAGYYFMPIYVAIASAEVFKTDKYVAAIIGAMMLAPEFVELVNSNTSLTIFGLPIVSTTYGNQMIPSVLAIFIESKIYNFLDKHFIEKLKLVFVPMITIVIMIPITFCLIGPIGVYLGEALVKLTLFLKDLGPIGNGIFNALIPFIVVAGISGGNLTIMLSFAATGVDPIAFFANVCYNCILGFVVLALYIKDKKAETLAIAIASAIGGISEPAIFSIGIKDFKVLLATSIGGFVSGVLAGLFAVKSYALASFGIFGVIATIGGDTPIIYSFIAIIIGSIIGFTISLLTHKKTA